MNENLHIDESRMQELLFKYDAMKEKEKALYWHWITAIPSIGSKTIASLLHIFLNPFVVYFWPEEDLKMLLKPKQFSYFLQSKDLSGIKEEQKQLEERNVRYLFPDHSEYPEKLRNLHDYPYGFYLKGRLPDENLPSIAIVGARSATNYGLEMAKYFARELSKRHVQIISGLAWGVDAAAHKGALQVQGYTLGILGSGINVCYPQENYMLYEKMEKGGGILSEYGLGIGPKAGFFPMRNRLIAAMSDGIFVTEAQEKSGSLITVDLGLELGKDIYALPGKITDAYSAGCNHLIASGAKMVTKVEDILEELHFPVTPEKTVAKTVKKGNEKKEPLVNVEKIVYSVMRLEPKHIDTIIEETAIPLKELVVILAELEKKGYIEQKTCNYYSALY